MNFVSLQARASMSHFGSKAELGLLGWCGPNGSTSDVEASRSVVQLKPAPIFCWVEKEKAPLLACIMSLKKHETKTLLLSKRLKDAERHIVVTNVVWNVIDSTPSAWIMLS